MTTAIVNYENLSNEQILTNFQDAILEKVKRDYKEKIKNGKALKSHYLRVESDPEPYTIRKIEPLIKKYLPFIDFEAEVHKKTSLGKLKKPDAFIESRDLKVNKNILIEWEPFNEDLRARKEHGVNQAKVWISDISIGQYNDALVTNGRDWILITTQQMRDEIRVIEHDLTVKDALKLMENIYNVKKAFKPPLEESIDITEKFYNWYVALIHGGEYIDKNNKRRVISKQNCLFNNVLNASSKEEKEKFIRINFTRLIFIRILTEYGIIKEDILNFLKDTNPEDFYNRINQLFFETLNTPPKERENIPKKYKEIPFLNGGLFRKKPIDYKGLKIRKEAYVDAIEFLRTFHFKKEYEYNENNYYIDNTIDPEILGHILEKTIEDRKESGVFYTPQVITKFMANDIIENYLKEKIIDFLKKKNDTQWKYIDHFNDIFNFNNLVLKKIFNAIIKNIKICDPAVGSGAFLLSCGNKLFYIRKKILKKLDINETDTKIKKEIIQGNLYGVDIKEVAVDICKLRLWLWIIQKGDEEPLPNIDFNIRKGNSLVGYTNIETIKIDKEDISSWQTKADLIKNFLKRVSLIKNYYSLKSPSEHKIVKNKIDEITNIFNGNLNKAIIDELEKEKLKINKAEILDLSVFHWIMEFSEVFEKNNGFDLIIGNPPYFRITFAPKLEQNIIGKLGILKKYHHGQGDIYYDFIVRSYELLRPGGHLNFITSRYWLESTYANYLKKFLKEQVNLKKIIDFREHLIFKGVDINNLILSYTKERTKKNNSYFTVFLSSENFTLKSKSANLVEYLTEIGKFNIDNWEKDENWAFVPKEQKELFMKIRRIKTKLRDDYNCNQYSNSFRKKNKPILTFEGTPNNFPEKYLRKYRKMGEIKKFSVDTIYDKYVMVIHNLREAWNDKTLNRYLISNNVSKNDIIEIKYDSGKNIDKYDEVIYIAYRINRLTYNFIYNNDHTWVDNTYFITKKKSTAFSLKYVVAILNSELMRYYIDVVGKKKDFEIEIGANFIKNLPLIVKRASLNRTDLDIIEEIEVIISKIINFEKQNIGIDNLIEDLNKKVYELYRINKNEQVLIKAYLADTSTKLYKI